MWFSLLLLIFFLFSQLTSEHVFVPLCIGGGIRDYTDSKGVLHTALDVAAEYFRSVCV